jgi:polyhydroxyalkanoate synthase
MSGQSVFSLDRTLAQRRQAVANLFDFVVRGDLTDRQRMPSEVIDAGRLRTVHRYRPVSGAFPAGNPVLLVPPPGARAACFDLRRGCSLTEHLLKQGRRTYLVDYGPLACGDQDLGLEFWINEVLPQAVRAASADSGREPVHLVGWCVGGLLSIGAVAADQKLRAASVTMVASPFDLSRNPFFVPLRRAAELTRGTVTGSLFRALDGAPAPLVSAVFSATSPVSYLNKPLTRWRYRWKYRDDRDFPARIEAVDELMNTMRAFPGRATLQAYHRLGVSNELAAGTVRGPDRDIRLANVDIPVMSVAGSGDGLVPAAAAHQVGGLLPNAPHVRLEVAPGGHLGVLTGRSAAATTWTMLDEFLAKADTHPASKDGAGTGSTTETS